MFFFIIIIVRFYYIVQPNNIIIIITVDNIVLSRKNVHISSTQTLKCIIAVVVLHRAHRSVIERRTEKFFFIKKICWRRKKRMLQNKNANHNFVSCRYFALIFLQTSATVAARQSVSVLCIRGKKYYMNNIYHFVIFRIKM